MPRPRAIDELYRSHGPAVLRRARRILGDEGEAQEVLQDVFASLIDRPDQFAGRSSPMTFLYRMTTNCALQRIRKRENRLRLLQTRYVAGGGSSAPDQESRARLTEALRRLPDAVAQMVIYYYVDGMTQQEVAELMGCSRQWIDKQLQRLRREGEGEGKPC